MIEKSIKRKLLIERVFLSRPDSYAILAVKIKGNINLDQLDLVLQKLRQKYPILGTHVSIDEEHKAWLISDHTPKFPVKIVEKTIDHDWIKHVIDEYKSFYPLDKGPLIRFILLKDQDNSTLIISGYHLLIDGISLPFLLHTIMQFLENPDIPVISLLTPPLHEVLPLPLKISFGQKIMNKIAHILWNRKVKKGMAFGLADYSKIHSTFCPLIYKDLNIIAWNLNEQQTSALASKCKQENVSINTAICTAFIMADHEVQKEVKPYINKILLPINIRDILIGIPPDAIGLYVSTIDIVLEYNKNNEFWKLAKLSQEIIQKGLNKQNILNLLARAYYAPEQISDAAFCSKYNIVKDKFLELCLKITNLDKINYSYSISNLGKYDFPKNYGNWELEKAYFHTYGEMAEKQLGIITIGNNLTFTSAFRSSVISREIVEKIKDIAMQYLMS